MKPLLKWVVIGDMVGSRRVGPRPDVRERIEGALARVNRAFSHSIWAPLRLIKGIDEFSGVLESPEPVLDILGMLNLRLHPLRFRLAAGFGEVRALSPGRDVSRMDGSAFYRASEAMERARREHLPLALGLDRQGLAPLLADAAEAAAALASAIREKWPAAVREVATLSAEGMERELTQKEIARRTRRSQQAVSRAAVRGRFRDLSRGGASVRKLLAELSRQV
jgi:hypothetical protein